MAPCIVLVLSSLTLVVAALGASGAASIVRYPDNLPVYAGLLAAAPPALFGLVATWAIWLRTFKPFQLRTLRMLLGFPAILAAIVLVFAYAFIVDDPDHYKGQFNNAAQEWDPRVPNPGSYIALIVGVATLFPMGALGVTAKYLYVDGIEGGRLDAPEGYDPIGIMLRDRD